MAVEMCTCLCKMNCSADGQVCSQNNNKQIVNIADETLTNSSSFLSRYRFTKSKSYLKRRYIEFVTEFPYLLGYPV